MHSLCTPCIQSDQQIKMLPRISNDFHSSSSDCYIGVFCQQLLSYNSGLLLCGVLHVKKCLAFVTLHMVWGK